VIDGLVASGRELTDTGLLAALLLPKVLLKRYDVEAAQKRPMSRGALEILIQEEVAPFLARFTVSNLKSQQIGPGPDRLPAPLRGPRGSPASGPASPVDRTSPTPSSSSRSFVRATGEGHEALADWQAAARKVAEKRTPAEAEVKARPPGGDADDGRDLPVPHPVPDHQVDVLEQVDVCSTSPARR